MSQRNATRFARKCINSVQFSLSPLFCKNVAFISIDIPNGNYVRVIVFEITGLLCSTMHLYSRSLSRVTANLESKLIIIRRSVTLFLDNQLFTCVKLNCMKSGNLAVHDVTVEVRLLDEAAQKGSKK